MGAACQCNLNETCCANSKCSVDTVSVVQVEPQHIQQAVPYFTRSVCIGNAGLVEFESDAPFLLSPGLVLEDTERVMTLVQVRDDTGSEVCFEVLQHASNRRKDNVGINVYM